MTSNASDTPCLRPVEAFRTPDQENGQVHLRDRTGLSDVVLTMSEPALHVLAMMDGTNTCGYIRRQFREQFNQELSEGTLQKMIEHLDRAHFLESAAFESYYASCESDYRDAEFRDMPYADAMGIEKNGDVFAEALSDVPVDSVSRRPRGLVVPHLDYPRGGPCYAQGYATLRDQPAPDRVIILGTNHFGRSQTVVSTAQAFRTPLGTTKPDLDLLAWLEEKCGDLREYELDHQREHSIELQVAWLQFLFGADTFVMLPFLCPDPCGPTGTAPVDGRGVDLHDFAITLREAIGELGGETLLVAGADLSHVGASFGDDRPLDDTFLSEVEAGDCGALSHLQRSDPDGFVAFLTERDNPTRVCSAGCLYTLSVVLSDATPQLMKYHQAVDQSTQTCVTCAAMMYT